MDKMMTLYEVLGREPGIRKLVDRFYDLMETEETARTILALHPPDLSESREKTYLFLVGWSGGPPVYVQKFGHPRLRARHLPFAIDSAARDAWMHCMSKALREQLPDPDVCAQIEAGFWRLANHMRNTRDAD